MLHKLGVITVQALRFITTVAIIVAAMYLLDKEVRAADLIAHQWTGSNLKPFAASRDEAMSRKVDAFKQVGFPNEVFFEFLRMTAEDGEKVIVQKGDTFQVVVGRGVVQDVVVGFSEPRPAEVWSVKWEGRMISLYLIALSGSRYSWGVQWSSEATVSACASPISTAAEAA